MGGLISETSSDTPEQIASCLNCPYMECVNCLSSKKKHIDLPVLQMDFRTGEVLHQYRTVTEASSLTNIPKEHIYKCIGGHKKSAGGYLWDRISDK